MSEPTNSSASELHSLFFLKILGFNVGSCLQHVNVHSNENDKEGRVRRFHFFCSDVLAVSHLPVFFVFVVVRVECPESSRRHGMGRLIVKDDAMVDGGLAP